MLPLHFQVPFGDVSTEALGYRLLPFLLSWAAFWSLKNKVKYTHWRKNVTVPVGTRLFGHRKKIFPAFFIITADLTEHTNKGLFAAQGKKCWEPGNFSKSRNNPLNWFLNSKNCSRCCLMNSSYMLYWSVGKTYFNCHPGKDGQHPLLHYTTWSWGFQKKEKDYFVNSCNSLILAFLNIISGRRLQWSSLHPGILDDFSSAKLTQLKLKSIRLLTIPKQLIFPVLYQITCEK